MKSQGNFAAIRAECARIAEHHVDEFRPEWGVSACRACGHWATCDAARFARHALLMLDVVEAAASVSASYQGSPPYELTHDENRLRDALAALEDRVAKNLDKLIGKVRRA